MTVPEPNRRPGAALSPNGTPGATDGRRSRAVRRAWGPWRLDPERLVLDCYRDGDWTYQVDLEHCLSSPAVLDRIAQVRGKSWPGASEAEVVGYLVMALDDVLYLQSTLCSAAGTGG